MLAMKCSTCTYANLKISTSLKPGVLLKNLKSCNEYAIKNIILKFITWPCTVTTLLTIKTLL